MKHVLSHEALILFNFDIIRYKFLLGNSHWIRPYLFIRYNVVDFYYDYNFRYINKSMIYDRIYDTFKLYLDPFL